MDRLRRPCDRGRSATPVAAHRSAGSGRGDQWRHDRPIACGSGQRLVIVDRRRKALLGSTAASTAVLQFELDTPLTQLGAVIGRRKAAKVWIASRDAVNELRTRSHRLGIFATPSKPGRAFTHLTTLSKSNATAEVPLCTRVMAFASTLGTSFSAPATNSQRLCQQPAIRSYRLGQSLRGPSRMPSGHREL